MVANKQIKVTETTKKILDKSKKYPRETYEDVILRLLKASEDAEVKK